MSKFVQLQDFFVQGEEFAKFEIEKHKEELLLHCFDPVLSSAPAWGLNFSNSMLPEYPYHLRRAPAANPLRL